MHRDLKTFYMLRYFKELWCFRRHLRKPHAVKFYTQGEPMADVTLKQGQSVSFELHYVDANGNDLGVVPAGDSPSITVDQPAELALSITGGAGSGKNSNTGTGDVTVSLSGSAKGFTTSASIICAGTGATTPTPTGVKFVFGTPTP